MACQLVRIVAWRARHGENTAGLHFDGHGRAVIVGETVVGGLLDLRIDGRFDGRALVLLAGEQRFEPLPHQLVGLARQQRAARGFDTAPTALADGEEAGDRRIQLAGRIGALIGERVVRRVGFGDDGAVRRENRATRSTILVVEGAGVARIAVELVRADRRDDRGGHAQNDEQRHHDGEQLAK